MFLGIYGGRFTASMSGVLPTDIYDKGLVELFVPYNVFFAMMKAYTFAFILSSIPAYFGYYVQGGSLEIGRSSTKSVVITCIVILLADYILAALLL
jgi:phospholipid/cholesterol/gamma-HCH transport system permease protein